jgi:hypothetical protein
MPDGWGPFPSFPSPPNYLPREPPLLRAAMIVTWRHVRQPETPGCQMPVRARGRPIGAES